MTPAQQLNAFIDKFDPKVGALIKSVRKSLRAKLPGAKELVYDNYNFFVIGFCATERASEAVMSIAAAANGVSLCFLYGAKLPDPDKLLRGSGNKVRSIRLESAATLKRPEVARLISLAIGQSPSPFPLSNGKLIIKSVSAKQRPRRKVQ